MANRFLTKSGALSRIGGGDSSSPAGSEVDLSSMYIPDYITELLPESVARQDCVFPIDYDGETVTIASTSPDDIAIADRLRFLLAKNVILVPAPGPVIVDAINRHYGHAETESVDSMLCEFTDTAIDFTETEEPAPRTKGGLGSWLGRSIVEFKKGVKGADEEWDYDTDGFGNHEGGGGMFYYTVEEGQRVLMRNRDGTLEEVVGPRRIWRGSRKFTPMRHYTAYPGQFLNIRYRDGKQEHKAGPVEAWLDPRVHQEIVVEDALQLAAKEAVVVYSKRERTGEVTRRIVNGPTLFVPEPGEWLHTFSWHASQGGHKGVQKVPNALVFQKLWLLPDQMYHDVIDVRTADDAVLTVRLMIFFELVDIGRMLDSTHDPIGDFVNAATSDVVDFTGRHDFENFKRNTHVLNELETYRQLLGRAAQCGYRLNKVVYRGYGSADALQQMHDEAIQARTRLQLDRATEQQSQDLENYKLECQLARARKRREEQTAEVEHDLGLSLKKKEAELRQREIHERFQRDKVRQDAEARLETDRLQYLQQREHYAALRDMGVDLTAYLTQARADRVIEVRGGKQTHVHLDSPRIEQDGNGNASHP